MVRGVYKSLVVDSAKLLESPTKKLLSYADVLTDQWQYSRGRGHVSYHRNMSPDFNLITGLDPWGRQFVKSIFYDESRKPDKIATWRLIPSISNKIYGRTYTAHGYTTVDKHVVQLRVASVDSNDMLLISPHFTLYDDSGEIPTYIV